MNNKPTKNDFFSTSDLCLSACLLCLGFKLDTIEKSQPKSTFIFLRTEGLDKVIQAFWGGEVRVEPKAFFNCLKELKSRLYSRE